MLISLHPTTSGLGQATPAPTSQSAQTSSPTQAAQPEKLVTIDDPRVAAWAVAPADTAEREAVEFYKSLEVLREDAKATAEYLETVKEMVGKRREELERLKSEAKMLKAQGMGELIDFERTTGLLMDPNSISGIMDSVRKAFKDFDQAVIRPASQPFKDAGRAIDKAVIRPAGDVLQKIEKYTIRPAAEPVDDALKKIDKAIIRPWSQPLHDGLKKVEKYTVRPAAKEAQKGMEILDKYVPGWTTLLDFIAPIPIGTILSGASAAARGGNLATTLVGSMLPAGNDNLSRAVQGAVKVADKTAQLAAQAAQPATQVIQSSGAGQFAWTLSKGTLTFINTKGSFLEKLEAVTMEALSGLTLVVSIAAAVVTGGTSLAVLQAALSALQAGVTLAKAQQAAIALKQAAREARDRAQIELDKIAAEEAAYLAEIAKIRAQIDEIRRQRTAVQTIQGKVPVAASPIARTAEKLGVSELTLVVSGLAVIAGLVVVVTTLQEGE